MLRISRTNLLERQCRHKAKINVNFKYQCKKFSNCLCHWSMTEKRSIAYHCSPVLFYYLVLIYFIKTYISMTCSKMCFFKIIKVEKFLGLAKLSSFLKIKTALLLCKDIFFIIFIKKSMPLYPTSCIITAPRTCSSVSCIIDYLD